MKASNFLFLMVLLLPLYAFQCSQHKDNIQKSNNSHQQKADSNQVDKNKTLTTMENNHYPRIEIYTEKNYAQQNTSADTIIDPNGKKQYMGSINRQLFVDRTTYLLTEKETEKLLKKELVFIPEFKEVKPNITLSHYFKMSKLQLQAEHKSLFPKDLDGYLSYDEEDRYDFETIIEYEKKNVKNIEIIWLNEDTWFVNNVFYRLELGDLIATASSKIVDEKWVEGDIKNLMKHSFVIQPKLDEGLLHLKQTL